MSTPSGDYRTDILDRLAAVGLEIEDEESREYTLILMDDVTVRFLTCWLQQLTAESADVLDDLSAFAEALQQDEEVRVPFLEIVYPVLDEGEFEQLVVLAVSALKYVDWLARQERRSFDLDFIQECAGALAAQARQHLRSQGRMTAYLIDLTPPRFVRGVLEELARQSAELGMGIFD